MKPVLFLLVCIACSCAAMAQSPDWTVTIDEEILSATLSTNGNYLVCIVDRDEENVVCIDTRKGTTIWSKTTEDGGEFYGHFIDNTVYLLGNKDKYEFVNLADGTVKKELPIIGESWDSDLSWPVTSSNFYGDIGIFYFSDGFQIVNLREQKILHHSECSVSSLTTEYWNHKLLLVPAGSCDSLYVIDTLKGRIDYAMDLGSSTLNSRVLQHFAATETQMFLFAEDNILCIDLNSKDIPAIIPIDPEDPDVYLPVSSKNDLYLVVSDDDRQALYRCRDGHLMWQTEEGEVPGLVDVVRLYNNDRDLVLFTYQEDGKMGVHKLDMGTGKRQWSKLLFEQESAYEPGHLKASKTGAYLTAILVTVAANTLQVGNGPRMYYRPNWAAIEAGLTRSKSSEGYAYLLDTTNQSQLTIAMGGRIYTELKQTERDDYDGEGFVTLDLKDGSVISHTPAFIIAESEKKGDYNAVKFMTIAPGAKADVVLGSRDVYVVDGRTVQHLPYTEDAIVTFVAKSEREQAVSFMVDHNAEYHEYWLLDVSRLPAQKICCGRSTANNFVFPDTSSFGCMVYYNDGDLTGYPLQSGDVSETRLAVPAWTLTEDEMDDAGLGSVEENRSNSDNLQGIRVIDGSVYLLGSGGIGKVSSDGKCRWMIEWEPELLESNMGPKRIGAYFAFSTGEDTRIIHDNCSEARVVGEHEIDYEDVMVLTDDEEEIVVLDKSEGILYGYHAK